MKIIYYFHLHTFLEIIPLAGARPTRFTRNAVTQTTIMRDAKDILELDPGVAKRGLYKEYI